jgi:hypothetical protein
LLLPFSFQGKGNSISVEFPDSVTTSQPSQLVSSADHGIHLPPALLNHQASLSRSEAMPKDDSSIPAWQRATAANNLTDQDVPKPSPVEGNQQDFQSAEASAEQMPDFSGKDVDEMAPVPTREDAARFLDHPGTKNAAVDDKIRFLEVKGVQQEDIEALIPEAKTIYAVVGRPFHVLVLHVD